MAGLCKPNDRGFKSSVNIKYDASISSVDSSTSVTDWLQTQTICVQQNCASLPRSTQTLHHGAGVHCRILRTGTLFTETLASNKFLPPAPFPANNATTS